MQRFFASIPLILASVALGQGRPLPQWRVMEPSLAAYLKAEVDQIAASSLSNINSAQDWQKNRAEYRRQLAEMLGLWPEPERTELQATITGRLDHPEFRIEKLHFQSRPGLYVTANLYVPTRREGPAPAIVYVSGHGTVKKDGINYGAKAYFHQWGAWLARHGYVCMVLDTLQLGEIEGIHHGLYREKMWWWISRGYTPAGVEAWNAMRAIDYLQTRPEVDKEKIGITGRSGGGAYSWWTAALDERVKCAVPVAGIADMHNHVVDGAIEGHCDCMYMVNLYRWDFDKVAALVSPRALLVANTDKDEIFPLDGVVDVYNGAKRIYELQKADDQIGLLITEGGHKDTQDLQVATLRWFERFLKGKKDSIITIPMQKFFEPEQLKVFEKLPEDQKNTTAHGWFIPRAEPKAPRDQAEWGKMKAAWTNALKDKVFINWPKDSPLNVKETVSRVRDGFRVRGYELDSQENAKLNLFVFQPELMDRAQEITLYVIDEADWDAYGGMMKLALGGDWKGGGSEAAGERLMSELARESRSRRAAWACLAPRGVGAAEWSGDEKKRTQIRRRFWLLGQSDEAMRVWDVRRGIQALRGLEAVKNAKVHLDASRRMAGVAVYAALFEENLAGVRLHSMPASHMDGPDLPHILKYLDLPMAVAMLSERTPVELWGRRGDWSYPFRTAEKFGWQANLVIRE